MIQLRVKKKSYFDFIDEFNKEEILEGLVSYGMFSEKLPPIFEGIPFYEFCKNNKPRFTATNKDTNYIKYESMRNNNLPRAIGIPNPMNYYKLCLCISENWDNIKSHFNNKTQNQITRVSRIHIRKMKDENRIFQMNYKNFKVEDAGAIEFLLGAKYIIHADISTCFPSMYTHSIPWALVGREFAKNNRGDGHWFNNLDFYLRGTTSGETHGMLIGPHSSNILSEIILTCVDEALINLGWKYIRNIDDYTCYVSSYEDSQRFLLDLNKELKKFNLMLNHKKTKVLSLPESSTEEWVRVLNTASICTNEYLSYKDIKISLDMAIDLLKSNDNNAAILNYVIKVTYKKRLSNSAKNYYLKMILHLSILYPYLIPMLDEYIFEKYELLSEEIAIFSNLIFKEGITLSNVEMICYAFYFSLKYDFTINEVNLEEVRNLKHCILNLFGFLYSKNILNNDKEIKAFKKLAREISKIDDELNENWLFVYEVLSMGDLKSDWKTLKQANVTFLKGKFK